MKNTLTFKIILGVCGAALLALLIWYFGFHLNSERLGVDNYRSDRHPTYSYQVEEYNLGNREYITQTGATMPYQLRGVLGAPDGDGPFPLVMILHGSHENFKENVRFDTGFRYLVEELAKHGIIAVSVDIQQAYVWKYGDSDDLPRSLAIVEENMKLLNQAQTTEHVFNENLQNKIDFNQLSLIGHSRGADAILDLAGALSDQGNQVSSLLLVAPPLLQTEHDYRDIKTAIIVPEYDGDASSLRGIALYDMLNSLITQSHSVTLLKRANHNYFNDALEQNDAAIPRKAEAIADQIPREKQRKFLSSFAVDYFLAKDEHHAAVNSLNAIPNQLYDSDVQIRFQDSTSTKIAELTSPTVTENLNIEDKNDSWVQNIDGLVLDTFTLGDDKEKIRPLEQITWQQPSSVSFEPLVRDLSSFNVMAIDLLVDPSMPENQNLSSQSFSVELTDQQGHSSIVTIPKDLNALTVPKGSLVEETLFNGFETKYWSEKTPLSTVQIPLKKFNKLNLSHINSIKLIFGQTEQGSILFQNLRAQ